MRKVRNLSLGLLLLAAVASHASSSFTATLRHDRVQVIAFYDRLVAMSSSDAKQAYHSAPASLKEDLWTIRLERFVANHPELSNEQRAVIFEGWGLLATGVIEVASSADGRASIAAYEALSRFEYRAKTTLGVALAREALSTFDGISGNDSYEARASTKVTSNYGKYPVCSCSGDSDWCDTITNPTPKCRPDPCIETDGCGTFFLYTCNGICGPGAPVPPPPNP